MGQFIIKLEDKYAIYSTIVDAPIAGGMTLEELHEWTRFKYGQAGIDELPARLARVEAKGTSAINEESAQSTVSGNRAGKNESTLTWEQLVAWCNGPDDVEAPHGYYTNICAKCGDNHDSDERESLDDWLCQKCAPGAAA